MTRYPKPRRKEVKIRRASYLSKIWIETNEQEEQVPVVVDEKEELPRRSSKKKRRKPGRPRL